MNVETFASLITSSKEINCKFQKSRQDKFVVAEPKLSVEEITRKLYVRAIIEQLPIPTEYSKNNAKKHVYAANDHRRDPRRTNGTKVPFERTESHKFKLSPEFYVEMTEVY